MKIIIFNLLNFFVINFIIDKIHILKKTFKNLINIYDNQIIKKILIYLLYYLAIYNISIIFNYNCYYNICSNLENRYKYFLWYFNANILNIAGTKYITKGVNNEVIKLNKESFNKWVCVFLYIPQKQVT